MEPHDTDDAAPRPRGIGVLAAFTGFAGMLSGHISEASLRAFRATLDPPHDLNAVWDHAVVHAAQAHRRAVVARETAALVLAVLLFIASTRVFLGGKNAGWLWRQALGAQLALAGATVLVERHLAPARQRAFFDAARVAGDGAQPLAGTGSLDETLRALLTFSAALPMVWAAVVALLLIYATRPKVRAFTG